MKQRLVIYHAGCIDGFTAAWAAWTRFGDEDTEYLPAAYGSAPPDVTGWEVYIVDFSYPREVLLKLKEAAQQLMVFDHHKTAEADLKGLDFCVFDMRRSGAGLTWDSFHPSLDRPWLIDYVEDRDLWLFRERRSKEVNAYIGTIEQTFPAWDELNKSVLGIVADHGAVVLRQVNQYVREMLGLARTMNFVGYGSVPVVNAPRFNISELLNELAKGKRFAVGWYQAADREYRYSLRSDANGEDVSEIAKLFGGGGHKHAAGFRSALGPDLCSVHTQRLTTKELV